VILEGIKAGCLVASVAIRSSLFSKEPLLTIATVIVDKSRNSTFNLYD